MSESVGSYADIAAGLYDVQIEEEIAQQKAFLAGPDLIYGNGDDARLYKRWAYEANIYDIPWSPCRTDIAGRINTAADFRAAWRHVWQLYRSAGLDSKHVAFIFSVWATDRPGTNGVNCSMESLYPGDAYVDWVALDGYNWAAAASPSAVFGPMATRFRALTTKPLGVSEVGTDPVSVNKSQWISDYFSWLSANNVRMNVWFNQDKEEPWAVFGGAYGDTSYTYCLVQCVDYKGYSAYRSVAQQTWVRGPDSLMWSPRVLPDSVFLGQ